MNRSIRCLATLWAVSSAVALAEPPPLIPREVLFGNPDKAYPQISPDGKRLAYLAPDSKGVLQVWVRTVGKTDDRAITDDKKRGIRQYAWAEDNKTVLYLQDSDGDENWHIYGADLETSHVRDYTPFQGVHAELLATLPKFPDQALVTMNLRKPELLDVYRVTLSTGAIVLDTENPGDVAGWVVDSKMVVRGAQIATPEGGTEIRVRDGQKAPWRTLVKSTPDDELNALSFTLDGKALYLASSVGADKSRLVEKNLKNGAEKVLAENDKSDLHDVMVHPTKFNVQAAQFYYARSEWQVLDPSIAPDFEALKKVADGDFELINRDDSDRVWLVDYNIDHGPVRYYAYDRATKTATFLFTNRSKLEKAQLAKMQPVEIPSRDGLTLQGYLTLPLGVEPKNLPLVLNPHGGPWYRDTWGYNGWTAWLANRGYAVLQVNFRGSTGFGKKFLHLGDKQWGRAMNDDRVDAVKWAIEKGIADPKRVAVFGGSYGGYSALAGATFSPEIFRCAVDLVGPSNMFTFLNSIPPYWKPMLGMLHQRVGDLNDPKDAEQLKAQSPLFFADRIKIPMLIGQGANDPRVKQAESEQIVSAIEKNGKKAIYVVYPDEGHGFKRPENNIDFNARVEAFLAENLGGRAEPMKGEKYPGSTAVVRVVGGSSAPQAMKTR